MKALLCFCFIIQFHCNADCTFQIQVPMYKRASNVYSGVCLAGREMFCINLAIISVSGSNLFFYIKVVFLNLGVC